MQLGVDAKEFWSLTPRKLQPYIDAFQEKEKRELEQLNFSAWLNGIYMGYCLTAAFGEHAEYPEKPLEIFKPISEEEKIKREEQILSAFAATFNANF